MTAKTVLSTSPSFKLLTTAQILRLHSSYIYPFKRPTQPTLLESAVHGPLNTVYYGSTDQQNPFYLAANLAEKIMQNHAYQDGNKRTALLTAGAFLRLNGYVMVPVESGLEVEGKGFTKLEDAIVGSVVRTLTVESLGEYFRRICRKVGSRDCC